MSADPVAQSRAGHRTAEEAFRDYVGMDRDVRSLRALAETYVQRGYYKTTGTALSVLGRWSAEHRWQDRVKQAASDEAERKLREAAELDADTFLQTSRKLHESVETASEPETIIRIRESVRKPLPKGTSVSVNVSIEMQRAVDRIAEEDGLSEDEKRELLDRLSRRVAERR